MIIVCKKTYLSDSLRQHFKSAEVYKDDDDRAEILIAEPSQMTQEYLKGFPSLKLCLSPRDGYEKADIAYMKEHGIILCNAHGLYSQAIAEFIVMRTMEYACNSLSYINNQKIKKYELINKRKLMKDLTIGFIGTGSICKKAAQILKMLGTHTLGYKRFFVEKMDGFDELYFRGQLDIMLKKADVIVVGVDLNPSTYHLLGREQLSLMKKGAGLINIARGAVIDEGVIPEYLNEQKISFAALDVFEEEPLSEDSELWENENVMITPHASGIYEANHSDYAEMAIRIIEQYIHCETIENRVI